MKIYYDNVNRDYYNQPFTRWADVKHKWCCKQLEDAVGDFFEIDKGRLCITYIYGYEGEECDFSPINRCPYCGKKIQTIAHNNVTIHQDQTETSEPVQERLL